MSRASPVRTCVGCRERAAKSDLLRVAVAGGGTTRFAVPDERGRMAGRGAHLHPTSACLDLAERRRALPRALRLEGPLDLSGLRSWIESHRQASPEA
ncbi:MAG: YlxR family protein [Nocardioidaceae bacterium]|nr:YlxR family protein [Nocardioidaceae bacterium]